MPFAETACRIALTFFPAVYIMGIRRWKTRHLRPKTFEARLAAWPAPKTRRERIYRTLRVPGLLTHSLWMVPVAIIGLTVLASLERVPLTGRCVFLYELLGGNLMISLAGA